MEELKIKTEERLLTGDMFRLCDFLIRKSYELSQPSVILQAIDDIKNLVQAQKDYDLPTQTRYCTIDGIDKNAHLMKFEQLTEKIITENTVYEIKFIKADEIEVYSVELDKPKERLYDVIKVTITQTRETTVYVVVDSEETEPYEIAQDYVDNLTKRKFDELFDDVDYDVDLDSDYYMEEVTKEEIDKSYVTLLNENNFNWDK